MNLPHLPLLRLRWEFLVDPLEIRSCTQSFQIVPHIRRMSNKCWSVCRLAEKAVFNVRYMRSPPLPSSYNERIFVSRENRKFILISFDKDEEAYQPKSFSAAPNRHSSPPHSLGYALHAPWGRGILSDYVKSLYINCAYKRQNILNIFTF